MPVHDFRYGFRVLGDCRQPRRSIDHSAALAAYAACEERAELHREAYLSAFQFGTDFRDHLDTTGSTKGYSGPCWTRWLWWDIDHDGDLPAALEATRRLCGTLVDGLGVDPDDVLAFLSGSKGYHVGIPTALWSPEPGGQFHRIARHFAEHVAKRADVTIDTGVYDRVRCFRAPNSRHPKTGLYKRPLTLEEINHLTADRTRSLAAEPLEFELPEPTYRSEQAASLWTESASELQREAKARAALRANGNQSQSLNRSTLEFIRRGASDGDRHRLTYSAAANLAELGAPLDLCSELLTEAALDCGLPPNDVRRAIENGWASAQPGPRELCEAFRAEVVDVQPPADTERSG